jgi:hypothetical protein
MASALAPGLARKVKKILDTRTESPELTAALATLSSFYDANTPAARRALRGTVEQRGLDINQRFLEAAETVIQVTVRGGAAQAGALPCSVCGRLQAPGLARLPLNPGSCRNRRARAPQPCPQSLDEVQAQLDALAASCGAMSSAIAGAKTSAGPLLSESERLAREAAAVEAKAGMVVQFLEQYQLTPEEVRWGLGRKRRCAVQPKGGATAFLLQRLSGTGPSPLGGAPGGSEQLVNSPLQQPLPPSAPLKA